MLCKNFKHWSNEYGLDPYFPILILLIQLQSDVLGRMSLNQTYPSVEVFSRSRSHCSLFQYNSTSIHRYLYLEIYRYVKLISKSNHHCLNVFTRLYHKVNLHRTMFAVNKVFTPFDMSTPVINKCITVLIIDCLFDLD